MREIKFRLRIYNEIVGYEKWFPGEIENSRYREDPRWLYSKDGKYWHPTYIFHNKKDLYTGLKDKNGEEIYEGNIMEDDRHIFEIKCNEYGIIAECINGMHTEPVCNLNDNSEVIGNIYENKWRRNE